MSVERSRQGRWFPRFTASQTPCQPRPESAQHATRPQGTCHSPHPRASPPHSLPAHLHNSHAATLRSRFYARNALARSTASSPAPSAAQPRLRHLSFASLPLGALGGRRPARAALAPLAAAARRSTSAGHVLLQPAQHRRLAGRGCPHVGHRLLRRHGRAHVESVSTANRHTPHIAAPQTFLRLLACTVSPCTPGRPCPQPRTGWGQPPSRRKPSTVTLPPRAAASHALASHSQPPPLSFFSSGRASGPSRATCAKGCEQMRVYGKRQ